MQNQPTSLSIINEFLNDLKAIDKGNHLKERLDFILNAVKGKKVLDIGIIDHSIKNCFSQNWMHGKILQEASHCIGVDILSEDIEKLREHLKIEKWLIVDLNSFSLECFSKS